MCSTCRALCSYCPMLGYYVVAFNFVCFCARCSRVLIQDGVCVFQNPSALLSYLLSMALNSCPGHVEVNNKLSIICLLDFLANSSNVCWFGKVLGLGMCSNVCWFGNVFEICTILFHMCLWTIWTFVQGSCGSLWNNLRINSTLSHNTFATQARLAGNMGSFRTHRNYQYRPHTHPPFDKRIIKGFMPSLNIGFGNATADFCMPGWQK